jgi:hypothetical protein
LYDHLMSTEIFTIDNELDTHLNSKKYEANDYRHNLHLLIISHY